MGKDRVRTWKTVSPFREGLGCQSLHGGIHANLSRYVTSLAASFNNSIVRVYAVDVDLEDYGRIKPRASQSNQLSTRLGLTPVFRAQRLNLRLFRPSQRSGIGRTEHAAGHTRQTNHNSRHDEADTVPARLSGLGSIPIVLNPGTGDLLAICLFSVSPGPVLTSQPRATGFPRSACVTASPTPHRR